MPLTTLLTSTDHCIVGYFIGDHRGLGHVVVDLEVVVVVVVVGSS